MISQSRISKFLLAVATATAVFAAPAIANATDAGGFRLGTGTKLIFVRGGGGGGGHFGGGGGRHFGGSGLGGALGHVGAGTFGGHGMMLNHSVGSGIGHMSRGVAGGWGPREHRRHFGWVGGPYGYDGFGSDDCNLMDPAFRVRPYLCE
jgi:hypothetical protein